jgi:hypothetical protein
MISASDTGGHDFKCRVRYQPSRRLTLAAGDVERLCRSVEERGQAWGTAICSFLALRPPEAVTITLRPGLPVSMTRGTEVVVGVTAGIVSAALAHELVHAVTGRSENHAYREGVAVYVDSTLRLAGPAWPFFHLAPDRWVRMFVEDGTFVPLTDLTTGAPALPSTGGGTTDAARFYLEAGSFVGFLLQRLGREAFWSHFRSGRLPAGRDDENLEAEWLAQLGGGVTDDDRRLCERSMARLAENARPGVPSSPGRERGRCDA